MKFYSLILLVILVGCSNAVDYEFIGKQMNNMNSQIESFALGNQNYDQLRIETKKFNDILNKIDTKDPQEKKMIYYQLKANNLRLEGVKESDQEKITESAKYQSFAEGILYELEDSN